MTSALLRPALTRVLSPVLVPALYEARATGFTPASLFAAGEKGGAYDFTDTSKLFQLSGGTTAVTSVTDPIGYVTDLTANAKPGTQATGANRPIRMGFPTALGSELATNGRMAADANWTKGAGWTIGSGIASKSAGSASVLSQSVALVPGTTYLVHFSMTRSAGTLTAQFTGGTTVAGLARSLSGSYIEVFTALSGNATIEFSADASFAGSVDNVSIKPVTAFGKLGASFDGAGDLLRTAAIDMSGGAVATLVASFRVSEKGGSMIPVEFGSTPAGTAGSFGLISSTKPGGRLRGSSALAVVSTPSAEGPPGSVSGLMVVSCAFDTGQAAQVDQAKTRSHGIAPTLTATGSACGGGNLGNLAFTLGNSGNATSQFQGTLFRAIVINRLLTATETVQAENWCKSGMAYCAVLGDSTVAVTNAGVALQNNYPICSLVAGMVCGAADVSHAGDKIADQKTLWNAIADKSALQAVFIQIGLNDCNTYGATKTDAQIIADLQDLVNTVNAAKPAGCKTYICALNPCRGWLGVSAGTQAQSYAHWQALNTAIGGGGATPITGVDGRITSHVAALSDGSDNLNSIYDNQGDGVHESGEGRLIIAAAWRAQLVADALVS